MLRIFARSIFHLNAKTRNTFDRWSRCKHAESKRRSNSQPGLAPSVSREPEHTLHHLRSEHPRIDTRQTGFNRRRTRDAPDFSRSLGANHRQSDAWMKQDTRRTTAPQASDKLRVFAGEPHPSFSSRPFGWLAFAGHRSHATKTLLSYRTVKPLLTRISYKNYG